MSKEFTNKDHEWAQQKLKRITNDPLLLIAVLEEQLRQYHAQKEYLKKKEDKK
jgi:hypothetical protein